MYCFTNYVIFYDVTCNKRATKILRILRGYCYQIQYSVFEGKLTKAQYCKLKQELINIATDDDSIIIYPLSYMNILNKVKIGKSKFKKLPIF